MKKVQGIVNIGRLTTTTEARALIVVLQYYRDMLPKRYHILAPLTETDVVPKGKELPWNDSIEDSFKRINIMVSIETLLNYQCWKLLFLCILMILINS